MKQRLHAVLLGHLLYLSGVNPAQATSGKDTDDVSGLVQVSLSSVYISDRTGKLSAYSLSFCVYPKN